MHGGFRVKTQAEREEEEKAERRKAVAKREARNAQTFEMKGQSHEGAVQWTEAQIEERILEIGATPKETAHILRVYIEGHRLLTRMPPRALIFTHCQDLNLSDNGITTLSTSPHLFAMTWLRSLSLSGNQLTTIPQEIDRFQELEYLNLDVRILLECHICADQALLQTNKLTSLPPSMTKLKRLKLLTVYENPALGREISWKMQSSNKEEAQERLAAIAEKFANSPVESVVGPIPTMEGADPEKCTVM